MFNVAILTPTTGICRMGYAQSLARLVSYFAQVRIFDDCPTQTLVTDAVEGSGIAENYENMIIRYLDDKETHWTHFLSIEDDMIFSPDNLHRLAKHKLPIVGGNYSTNKGSVLRFTASNINGRVVTYKESKGLEEVDQLPQGFTLVAREVYEKMPHPWYLMGYNMGSGNYIYQDGYFSEQARTLGYKLYVDHDVSKLLWHIGTKAYSYEDALEAAINMEEQITTRAMAYRAFQKPYELVTFLKYLKGRNLDTVVEIGTAYGGTFYAPCQTASDKAKIISVDMPSSQTANTLPSPENLIRYGKANQDISFIRADSHDEETKNQIVLSLGESKTDLLLIDGDHTYEGVKKDFEMYSPLVTKGGIIILHDICKHAEPECQVDKFWNEIKSSYKTLEIIDRNDTSLGYGIGIIEV